MTTFRNAIVRLPGENFADGITTAELGVPNCTLMLEQHAAYVEALRGLGLAVTVLEAVPDCPDAYFVEDVAVILPEVAVVTRPGAEVRRGEVESMVLHLPGDRPLAHIDMPGTLDGGDVLAADRRLFVGISSRTNGEGAEQLGRIAAEHGWEWVPVPVGAGLHLKSSVNAVGPDVLLVSEEFAGRSEFEGFERITVDSAESYACNTLWINGTLIAPEGFPNTRRKLDLLGMPVLELDVSEAHKMDGGLTCMSLRY